MPAEPPAVAGERLGAGAVTWLRGGGGGGGHSQPPLVQGCPRTSQEMCLPRSQRAGRKTLPPPRPLALTSN